MSLKDYIARKVRIAHAKRNKRNLTLPYRSLPWSAYGKSLPWKAYK